jgi:WD40 repeat protein
LIAGSRRSRQRVALAGCLAAALVAACSSPTGTPTGTVSPSPGASPEASTAAPSAVASPLASATAAAPSPVGAGRIVFSRLMKSGFYELFTVDPDGSHLRELLPGWGYSLHVPRWSPQGDLLSAIASTPTIVPNDAPHHLHLTTPPPIALSCTAWDPDGRTILCQGLDRAVAGKEGVYRINADRAALDPFVEEVVDVAAPKRLTTPPKGVNDYPGDTGADGRIAFVRATYTVLGLGEIWVADDDGSNAHKLTDTLSEYRIDWSRDGRWIVGSRDGTIELFDLQNLSADPVRITLPGGKISEPRFSPDGSRLVYVFTRTGAKTSSIETIATDGSGRVVLTTGQLDKSPDWAAPGF